MGIKDQLIKSEINIVEREIKKVKDESEKAKKPRFTRFKSSQFNQIGVK